MKLTTDFTIDSSATGAGTIEQCHMFNSNYAPMGYGTTYNGGAGDTSGAIFNLLSTKLDATNYNITSNLDDSATATFKVTYADASSYTGLDAITVHEYPSESSPAITSAKSWRPYGYFLCGGSSYAIKQASVTGLIQTTFVPAMDSSGTDINNILVVSR